MFAISTLAQQHRPWSTSKCDLAASCPKQFELKHIKKAPEEAIRTENNVGIVAHAILEHRVLGKDRATAMAIAMKKHPMTSTEKETLSTYEEPMEVFLRRFDLFCKTQNVTEVLTEKKWAVNDKGTATRFFSIKDCHGIAKGDKDDPAVIEALRVLSSNPQVEDDPFFRGVVDLAAITASKDVWVIDHKSGAVENIKYKKKQLDVYAVLAFACVPGMSGARCGIHSLINPAATQLQWLPYIDAGTIERGMLPWLFHYINESAEHLTTFKATPKDKWPCPWCPYNVGCSEWHAIRR